jgi:class 3 adenylate cyclase
MIAARLQGVFGRLASLGVAPTDSEEMRVRKATVTLAVVTVSVLAIAWVAVYAALGLYVSAAIPFGYQVLSIASLLVFARSRQFSALRLFQLSLMMVLPFLLQWSLGGFAASSAVSLWAAVAALGAVLIVGARQSIPWFAVFVALVIASGIIDPLLSRTPAAMPEIVRTTFFVLNVVGVTATAYLLVQYFVRAREREFERSERLLLNVLPRPIADLLKRDGRVAAQAHPDVTVLFADVVNFTPFADRTSPERVVSVLDELFSGFDRLADLHGLEKIKTIGDAYMAVGGLPTPRPDHAEAAVALAMDMQSELHDLRGSLDLDLQLRIGLASGPVIAGVIGRRKFIYDLWGDTVNMASRMESAGVPGRIQVTEATYRRLRSGFDFESRGPVEIKGKGPLTTYLLVGRRERAPAAGVAAPQPAAIPAAVAGEGSA